MNTDNFKKRSIVTAGQKEMVSLFRIVGIDGYEITNLEDLKNFYNTLLENRKNTAGILSTIPTELKKTKTYERIIQTDLPIVTLPLSSDNTHTSEEIGQIIEKAVGIKLDNLNL